MNINEIQNLIPKENIYINEPMSKHTSFKIGGPAECFIKIKTIFNVIVFTMCFLFLVVVCLQRFSNNKISLFNYLSE